MKWRQAAGDDYDYVVIGGGSAGCPLAARLSERSSNRVLLIEAGTDYPPGQEPPEILDIFAATAYADPRFVWSGVKAAYGPKPGNAPDQRRRVRYPAGRVIGGGSSINGMAANRGLPSDYDAWAEAGATGWNWEGVLPFFKKLETDSDFDGPLHGKDGPIRLQRYAPRALAGLHPRRDEGDRRRGLVQHRRPERALRRRLLSGRLQPHRHHAHGRGLALSHRRGAAPAQSDGARRHAGGPAAVRRQPLHRRSRARTGRRAARSGRARSSSRAARSIRRCC